MKKRYGFVSNSSSTSFYCNICNSYQDYTTFYQCPDDHIICAGHADYWIETSDCISEDLYAIEKKDCPICKMDIIIKDDLDKYMKRKYGITIESLKDDIKSTFGSGLDGKEKLDKYLKEE